MSYDAQFIGSRKAVELEAVIEKLCMTGYSYPAQLSDVSTVRIPYRQEPTRYFTRYFSSQAMSYDLYVFCALSRVRCSGRG